MSRIPAGGAWRARPPQRAAAPRARAREHATPLYEHPPPGDVLRNIKTYYTDL